MMDRIAWIRGPANLNRSQAGPNAYDPNTGLSPEVRDWGARLSLFPFSSARVRAEEVSLRGVERPGFLYGETGGIGHLVYVRVTVGEEQEVGTGPLPGILTDLAREIKAEPHVVRVHLKPVEEGVGVEYFGHDELERVLKEGGDHWRRRLLGRRTSREYLRLTGRGVSKLQVNVWHEPPGARPKRASVDSWEEKLLKEIFGETAEAEERNDFPGSVSVGITVDTLPEEMLCYAVSLSQLLQSALQSDEFFIFGCICGHPQCAGILSGVQAVHEDGLVVWRIRGLKPRRVVVFDRQQYQAEVLSKVREALALHKGMGSGATLAAGDRPERVQELLSHAEKELG